MEAVIEYDEVERLSFLDKLKFLSNFISKVVLYVLFLILILIFVVVAVYFFDLFYNLKTGKNTPPLFNAYVIVSPSMVPNINVNDAIVVRRELEENLEKGDIITFSSNDGRYQGLTITHRIVGIQVSQNGDRLFRTKGDANNVEDSALVKYEDIYGKVMLKIPKLGYIQSLLVNSYGWLFLIVVPCVGVIIYDLIKMAKGLIKPKKLEDEDEESENDEEANSNETSEEVSKIEESIEEPVQQEIIPQQAVVPNVVEEIPKEAVTEQEVTVNVVAETPKESVPPIGINPNDIVEVPIVENTVSTTVVSPPENINTAVDDVKVEEDDEII